MVAAERKETQSLSLVHWDMKTAAYHGYRVYLG